MTEPRRDLTQYRLQRAQETLEDARILAEAGRWNTCVNRLYYACFYAVSALLSQQGLASSKHTGIRSLFNYHYVRAGKVSKESAQLYNDLFERRQEGDYLDFVSFDEAQVRPWMTDAELFVDHIASIIERPKN